MKNECLLFVLLFTLTYNGVSKNHSSRPKLRRNDFPKDFIFGSATSAYQCEGAAHEDGRGPSIWDTFSENFPEKILDGSNGSIADDSYYLYKEDVNLLHQIGFKAYRFSISWSRILPRGNLKGGINQVGIDYYNNLINQLLSKGVKPFVTIFHWDLPEALESAYGGFLGAEIVNDFRDYAELCFQSFGDRVKHWMTLNEPFTVVNQGYITGEKAPGRCSSFTKPDCTGGDGATEPYIIGHNFLLAHGAAVKLYREKYQETQKGKIGIALNTVWHYPYSDSDADKLAAARATAFTFDYFMEPIVNGKYPSEMVSHVKDGRLPTFTLEESSMLRGSYDFIGINYYSSFYAKDVPCAIGNITMATDSCISVLGERDGVPIGPTIQMANIEKLQFPALDITGANYTSWTTNVELKLESLGLSETIKEKNNSSAQENATSVILLRKHLDESIIYDYAHIRNPKELWKSLKDRFDHQRDITLPLARDEWQNLRFQDFDKVMNYNSAVLRIVAKLRCCGETITEAQMLEKTYTTFHKSHITLQQQYRMRGYTKFSDLIVALLIAEKNNELLIKNHMIRPTGSKSFPEVNALAINNPIRENQAFRGRGRRNNRGRGRNYNPQNRRSFQWIRPEKTSKGKEIQGSTSKKYEDNCFRCGTKGHWSRICRTPAHLCALYKESLKGKEKEVNFAENSEGTTHLDASDFANDFDDVTPAEN